MGNGNSKILGVMHHRVSLGHEAARETRLLGLTHSLALTKVHICAAEKDMEKGRYWVEAAPGHPPVDRNRRRGVAFLVSDKDAKVTAKQGFARLTKDATRKLHTGIDYWLGGYKNPRLFHGWDKSEFGGKYDNCFVFKSRDDKQAHRFYGFLCNPSERQPRFQLCVLLFHETKDENETDETILKRIESFRINIDVTHAVTIYMDSLASEFEGK